MTKYFIPLAVQVTLPYLTVKSNDFSCRKDVLNCMFLSAFNVNKKFCIVNDLFIYFLSVYLLVSSNAKTKSNSKNEESAVAE